MKLPTDQLLTELSSCLDRESGSLQPKDDLSIVIVEVKKEQESTA